MSRGSSMFDDGPPRPSGGLVRAFSDKWKKQEPNNILSQSLASKVDEDRERKKRVEGLQEQWNLLFVEAGKLVNEVPDEEKALLEQSGRLAKIWEKFVNKLDDDQRESVRGGIPDLTTVRDAVRAASVTWQDKRDYTKLGKVKRAFAKLYQSCDDHSSILSIIPNDDKYVSLIAGSLSAIAKATINHQNIAEAISDTLGQLCDEIDYCRRLVTPYKDNPTILRWVREFYIVVFEFLTDIFTSWSTSPRDRIRASFDKSAFDKLFTTKRQRMKDISSRLEREGNLASRLQVQEQLQRMGQNMEQNFVLVLQGNTQAKDLFSQVGVNGQKFLEELDLVKRVVVAMSTGPGPSALQNSVEPMIEEFQDPEHPLDAQMSIRQTYRRKEILENHARFQELLLEHDQGLRQLGDRASRLSIDRKVARHISAWAGGKGNSRIWVQGPAHMTLPSHTTLTAACVVASAEKSKLPVLSYFCRTSRVQQTSKETRLCTMLQSLIAQALRFVPEEISSNIDLSSHRLSSSIDAAASNAELLSLLKDLVTLIPNMVFYVVDSMQAIEQPSDELQSTRLRSVVDALCRETGQGPVSKAYFSTDGHVKVLARATKEGIVSKVSSEDEAGLYWGDDTVSLRGLNLS